MDHIPHGLDHIMVFEPQIGSFFETEKLKKKKKL